VSKAPRHHNAPLIEQGLEARKEKAFFSLAERFRKSSDPEEVKTIR
jgi:hypothetical protein